MILNNTIVSYERVLNEMPISELNLLETGLGEMRELGVGDFGYRSVNKIGESNIFSTSINWHRINKNTEFLTCLSEHMSSEILYAKKNNLKILTRSDDKVNTLYLKYLKRFGINNSVVTLKFGTELIEIFYFLINPEHPHCRDIILNNLGELDDFVDKMNPVFEFIDNSNEFQSRSNKILDYNTIKLLWRDDSRPLPREGQYTRLIYKDKAIFLTPQLLSCLLQLRRGHKDISNKFIGKQLDLAERTVKDHILKLSKKFGVGGRDQIIEIAQSEDMRYLDYSKNINQSRKAI